jgi:hypothetical protein
MASRIPVSPLAASGKHSRSQTPVVRSLIWVFCSLKPAAFGINWLVWQQKPAEFGGWLSCGQTTASTQGPLGY